MIVSAALLQRERGVPGTGVPEVLAHSGAPRGSVYHHFPDGRAQLAQEATAYAAGQLADGLDKLLEERSFTDVLDAFAESWIGVLEGEEFAAGCPVAAGALDHTAGSGARQAAADGFDRWTKSIERALQRSGVASDRAHLLALTAISAFEGAIILSRAKQSIEPLKAVTATLRELAERELASA